TTADVFRQAVELAGHGSLGPGQVAGRVVRLQVTQARAAVVHEAGDVDAAAVGHRLIAFAVGVAGRVGAGPEDVPAGIHFADPNSTLAKEPALSRSGGVHVRLIVLHSGGQVPHPFAATVRECSRGRGGLLGPIEAAVAQGEACGYPLLFLAADQVEGLRPA